MSSISFPRSFQRWILVLGLAVFVSSIAPDFGWSQDAAAPAADAAAADGEQKSPTTLMDMIIGGGIFMLPIGLLSIWMIALSVFLTLQVSKKKYVPKALQDQVIGFMSEVRVRSAIDAAAQDTSFLGRMITSSYLNVDATDAETLGRGKVEDAIADFTIRENLGTMTLIGYLSVIAQGATMLGLFGTVAGMVLAFDSMGLSGGSDPAALAGNISLALITTAGGLVVAIPAIFLFYFFKNRYNRLVSDAQQVAIEGLEAAIATVNADQALARVPEGITEV
ncbi:MAG: MotA/TolQ/ExbB proton channel family protein [Verrucomicrobiales bacterium]|nr:MotA/TolQ/ExbB proton channel family protein [Verrucomicrobiales bacterium]